MAKLQKNLGGIRRMKRLPGALVIIDPRRERSALREAAILDIPAICFQDTDSSPDMVDIIIPGNDDAMRSIQLICSKLMDAFMEGRAKSPLPPGPEDDKTAAPAEPEPPPAVEPRPAPAPPAGEASISKPDSAPAAPAAPSAPEQPDKPAAETATQD